METTRSFLLGLTEYQHRLLALAIGCSPLLATVEDKLYSLARGNDPRQPKRYSLGQYRQLVYSLIKEGEKEERNWAVAIQAEIERSGHALIRTHTGKVTIHPPGREIVPGFKSTSWYLVYQWGPNVKNYYGRDLSQLVKEHAAEFVEVF